MSLVPALTSATRPLPSGAIGACSSVAVLARGTYFSAGISLVGRESGDEHVLPLARELARDPHNLLRRLGLRKDDLRDPLAKAAVMVDDRVAEVDEGEVLQLGERFVDRRVAGA